MRLDYNNKIETVKFISQGKGETLKKQNNSSFDLSSIKKMLNTDNNTQEYSTKKDLINSILRINKDYSNFKTASTVGPFTRAAVDASVFKYLKDSGD